MNSTQQQIVDLSKRIKKLELVIKEHKKDKDALRSLYILLGRRNRLRLYLNKKKI